MQEMRGKQGTALIGIRCFYNRLLEILDSSARIEILSSAKRGDRIRREIAGKRGELQNINCQPMVCIERLACARPYRGYWHLSQPFTVGKNGYK